MSRIGNHRIRPSLSEAAKGKRQAERLQTKIENARAAGDQETVDRLERERAWIIINSMR